MDVPSWLWWVTGGVTSAFLLVDVLVIGRRPHEPSMKEVSRDLVFFILAAVAFGAGVWYLSGSDYATQFYAGWLTEYSLSVDNLFIFVIILNRFAVPREYQQTALLVGIVLALVMRGVFIGAGAAAINQLSWIFYLFGAFLVYTAVKLAAGHDDEEDFQEPRLVRWVQRTLPATTEYHGTRAVARVGGKRVVTPMFVVIVTLGMTDLLFALDSIPAIYGLTQEPFLVLTANVFALMGLRQLYFIIGGLLQRLVYLSYGLAALLGFIGVKLVLHALHDNELPFLNGGQGVEWAPDIPIWVSLLVVVGTLVVTAATSMASPRGRAVARDRGGSHGAPDAADREG